MGSPVKPARWDIPLSQRDSPNKKTTTQADLIGLTMDRSIGGWHGRASRGFFVVSPSTTLRAVPLPLAGEELI